MSLFRFEDFIEDIGTSKFELGFGNEIRRDIAILWFIIYHNLEHILYYFSLLLDNIECETSISIDLFENALINKYLLLLNVNFQI